MEWTSHFRPADSVLAARFTQLEWIKQEWEVLVDALPQVVCLIDAEGRILRANRTIEQWGLWQVIHIKGYREHDVLHPTCTDSGCTLQRFCSQA